VTDEGRDERARADLRLGLVQELGTDRVIDTPVSLLVVTAL